MEISDAAKKGAEIIDEVERAVVGKRSLLTKISPLCWPEATFFWKIFRGWQKP